MVADLCSKAWMRFAALWGACVIFCECCGGGDERPFCGHVKWENLLLMWSVIERLLRGVRFLLVVRRSITRCSSRHTLHLADDIISLFPNLN